MGTALDTIFESLLSEFYHGCRGLHFCSLTSAVGMNGFHRLSATSSAVF